MGATSATGVGLGSSNKRNINDLDTIANGPSIMFSGIVEADDTLPTSPPAYGNTVEFPYALNGSANNYVIMLTSINGGYAYVSDRDENGDGNFSGFTFIAEYESSVMYVVISVGSRPV